MTDTIKPKRRIHEVPGRTTPVPEGRPMERKKTLKVSAPQKKAGAASPPQKRGKKPARVANLPKVDAVIALLSAPEGVTMAGLMTSTGWTKDTIRGFIHGVLKGKKGLNVTSEKADGVRTYRIVTPDVEAI